MDSRLTDTWLCNSAEAIRTSLLGMVMMHSGLVILEGCNAVLRRDYNNIPGKVKIISGAMVENKPEHIEFVGPGMLTAAISGTISEPPSTDDIINVIEELYSDHCLGVLLIICGCIEYRLNFALAKMHMKNKGYMVEMITIHDDFNSKFTYVISEKHNFPIERFLFKVAGAMAEKGHTLNEIYIICNRILNSGEIASAGIFVDHAVRFKKRISDTSRNIQTEFKIHGGPTIIELPFTSFKDVATAVGNIIYNKFKNVNEKDIHNLKKVDSGGEVALILKNHGFTHVEANMFVSAVVEDLNVSGFNVQRKYFESSIVSSDLNVFQISALNLSYDSRLIEYLDTPTCVPGWPKILSAGIMNIHSFDTHKVVSHGKNRKWRYESSPNNADHQGPIMNDNLSEIFLLALTYACEALIACIGQLNKMDEEFGNGRCGTVLANGADAVKDAIKVQNIIGCRPSIAFLQIGSIVNKKMSGLHGTLYSMFFKTIAKSFSEYKSNEEINAHMWLSAFKAGNDMICNLGGLSIGNRTMLDALIPAERKLTDALNNNIDSIEAFGEAVKAAEESAKQTIYVKTSSNEENDAERKFKYPCPGAHAVGIWMRAAYEAVKLKFSQHC
ncbi:hypothetical protein KM043_018746 [Ampulex compressa]|nr:hypothetical protein KM043_018746 [Ampulex compressa]